MASRSGTTSLGGTTPGPAEAPTPVPNRSPALVIEVPRPALVLLVGASGAGKSTFARRSFRSTEVLSSDAARAMVADDEHDMGANDDAFELLALIADRRLARGRIAVVDATNLLPESRFAFLELARRRRAAAFAVLFDLPGRVLEERRAARGDRPFGPTVVRRQRTLLRRARREIAEEGFDGVWILESEAEVASAAVVRGGATP
jgi:predicted kinase